MTKASVMRCAFSTPEEQNDPNPVCHVCGQPLKAVPVTYLPRETSRHNSGHAQHQAHDAMPAEVSVYLQDPDVTILQGDALELLRGLPSGRCIWLARRRRSTGSGITGRGRGRAVSRTATTWRPGDGDGACDQTWDVRRAATPPLPIALARTAASVAPPASTSKSAWRPPPTSGWPGWSRCSGRLRRVLRDDGSLWLEIGDSYAAQRAARAATPTWPRSCDRNDAGWATSKKAPPRRHKPKDLIGAPWLLAFALRADGWYLRSEIIWAKPNPMPESVTDRPTVSHSRVFLLTKQARYFCDAEAIREPADDAGRTAAKPIAATWSRRAANPETGREGWRAQDTQPERAVTAAPSGRSPPALPRSPLRHLAGEAGGADDFGGHVGAGVCALSVGHRGNESSSTKTTTSRPSIRPGTARTNGAHGEAARAVRARHESANSTTPAGSPPALPRQADPRFPPRS